MKKLIPLIAVSTALFFTACDKDPEITVQSKTEMLTTGSWKITSLMIDVNGDGTYEMDALAGAATCETDNYIIFKTNGTTELNEGPTKCDPSDPQITNGTWAFAASETKINIDGDEHTIDELTSSTLRVTYPGVFGQKVTLTKRP
jgi:hypothetical protein